MYERLILMRELLSNEGSIYLHCDLTMGHYLKILMDEIFSKDSFRNEIIWTYNRFSRKSGQQFARMNDIILFIQSRMKTISVFSIPKVGTQADMRKGGILLLIVE